MVLAKIDTGLQRLISVTTKQDSVGYRHRPRLVMYYGRKQVFVTVDDPIEVLKSTPITGEDWDDVVAYIKCNRTSLIELWEGRIDRITYMNRQRAIE